MQHSTDSQPPSSTDADSVDNGAELEAVLEPYFRPDSQTIVCGALDAEKVAALAEAGVELVINLQPDDELNFDEAAAVTAGGRAQEKLPIRGAPEVKEPNKVEVDKVLRQ